ncbi:MAG: hypothetical protein K6C99_05265 [Lachnospiraceae bacterium]|nr:hypothetical protein [Lachnospiraceae bacterium]
MKIRRNRIALATATLFGTLLLAGCGRETINLNEYLEVETEGFDGYGTAEVVVDYNKLVGDHYEAFGLEDNDEEDKDFARVVEKLSEYVTVKTEDLTGLGNGDEIEVKWKVKDEKVQEKYKVKLTYEDTVETVDDLDAVVVFDPFAGIEKVDFTGTAPDGSASIVYAEEPQWADQVTEEQQKVLNDNIRYYYNWEKKDGFSNGDIFTVTIENPEDLKSYLAPYGLTFETESMDYTCEGLASYIKKIDEIPQDTMIKMQQEVKDDFSAYVADQWNPDKEFFNSMTYIGAYMLTPKDGIYGDKNQVYLVFRVNAENTGSNGAFDFYYCVRFRNIMTLADGTCSVDLSDTYAITQYFEKGKNGWGHFYYYGYEDLDSLFNKVVTSNLNNYTYESTVDDGTADKPEVDTTEEATDDEDAAEEEE